jgi:hypothetical protein
MFYRLLHHTGNELEQSSVSFHYMACGLCHLCSSSVAGLFFPNFLSQHYTFVSGFLV